MYSVVLMAALTTGAETPSFGWRHGCHGCWGGGWSGCCGCYGGGYRGGCYGGGCYGGCRGYGWGCNGCYGSWYGWYGCQGACYGGSPYMSQGYIGGGMVRPAPGRGGYAEPIPAPAGESKEKPKGKGESNPESSISTQAKLIVELPADAKLFIDNKLMQTTSARRVFATPRLEPGKKYYYDLRAEVVRDSTTLSDRKQVTFQAGEEVQASFAKLGMATAAKQIAAKAEK